MLGTIRQAHPRRGEMENLKADAQELKEVAKGEGSLKKLSGTLPGWALQYGGRSSYQAPSMRNARQKRCLAPSSSSEASMSGT